MDPQTKEDDPLMWMYYLAQIALRKLLNRVHTALYKQGALFFSLLAGFQLIALLAI
jgi:hypothetical protein